VSRDGATSSLLAIIQQPGVGGWGGGPKPRQFSELRAGRPMFRMNLC
jgi:hypothetical protein